MQVQLNKIHFSAKHVNFGKIIVPSLLNNFSFMAIVIVK